MFFPSKFQRPVEEVAGPVDNFRHEGKAYEHVIFFRDDDRVECRDREGKTVLIFTADCAILTPDRKEYGRLRMCRGSDGWESVIPGQPTLTHQDNLKLEVLISKQYLSNLNKAG